MEKIYTMSGGRVEKQSEWLPLARSCQEMLAIDLRQRGLTPLRAPELPSHGCEALAEGPYRFICCWMITPIEGYLHDEHDEPILDAEGELQYIYGEPGWFVRVDTIVEEPA